MSKRVTGIGGVFFKAKDPKALSQWYANHLDLELEAPGSNVSVFRWRYPDDPQHKGATVWAAFEQDTDYFGSADAQFMVNYRVEDLKAVLEVLRAEGVKIERELTENENGLFAWIRDPEGHLIELWQGPEDY